MIDLSARRLARAAGGELIAGDPERAGPEPGGDRLPGGRARRPVRGTARSRGGRRALRPGGAGSGGVGRDRRPRAPRGRAGGCRGNGGTRGLQRRGADSGRAAAGRARVAGSGMARRAGRQGGRSDRLDRQDLDQGHHRRPARHSDGNPREPRELEHGDRASADDPRGRTRDGGAGARDGHARRGADRGAGGGRGPRRRGDRQRGARAPRAAGDRRACGRRQGGADPRPAPRRRLRGAGQRAAARPLPARRPRHLDVRPGRRGEPAGFRRREWARRDRGAHGERRPDSLLFRAPQSAQHTGRRGRGAGVGRPRGRAGECALLLVARRGRGAARRGYRGQRLLQRQSDVDAGGPGPPRGERRRAPHRRARDDGRAGPRVGDLPPRDRVARLSARHRCARARGRRRARLHERLRR